MVTHSSILAWKIPWTEKPGRLQSTGSQSQTRLSDFTYLLNHGWEHLVPLHVGSHPPLGWRGFLS